MSTIDDGSYRYIVAKITTLETGHVERKINRNKSELVTYFEDLFFDESQKCDKSTGHKCECIGGGYLYVDSDAKKIVVWGTSSRYGTEPDRKQTVDALQKQYPEYYVFAR